MARDYKGIGNQDMTAVCIPVLTPDRAEKRQNGRRFKENGEPSFTLTGQDRHGVAIDVIGNYHQSNHDASRIVSPDGIAPCVRENHGTVTAVVEPLGILRNVRSEYRKEIRKDYETGSIDISRHEFLEQEIKEDGVTNTLSTVQKDNYLAEKVDVPVKMGYFTYPNSDKPHQSSTFYDTKGISPCLDTCMGGNLQTKIGVEIDVENDKQEEHPGIFVQLPYGPIVYAVWYEKYQCYISIRKLTPKECFRLQGWTDDYFEKAEFVNSNSQLYKQAGNGVTVTVIKAMADKMNI